MKCSMLSLFAMITIIAFGFTVVGPFVPSVQADSYTLIIHHYDVYLCPCGQTHYFYRGTSSGTMSHSSGITHSDPEHRYDYNYLP